MRYLPILLVFYLSPVLNAQPFESLPPADPARSLEYTFNKADLLVAITDMDWRPGLCLAAAPLSVGETAALHLSLEANTRYTFVASGSRPATDVDLYLRDENGEVVAEDQEPDATPVLEFRTSVAGQYLLQLRLAGSERPEDFVSLAILCSSGAPLIKDGYQRLASRFFLAAEQLRSGDDMPQIKRDWWRQVPQWSIYGFLLLPDGGASLLDLSTGAKAITFAAAAGDGLRDVDLYLSGGEHILASTRSGGLNPLLRYETKALNVRLDLRVEVARAKKTDLVLLGIFQE
jgi:hypothetical protein